MRWRFLKWHGWALALALPLLALAAASLAQAADPLPAYDPNSPGALEAKAKSDSFTRDGEALRTTDLVKELERLDNAKKFKMSMAKTPDEVISQMWSFDDDDMRTSSYSTVLQKRGEAGDPYASFFYGAHEWDFCQKMQRQEGDGWAKNAKDCWQRVMPAMKRASDAQISDATTNIAKLYEFGFGVAPSKYAAADWYVKSAEQYNKEKARDDALTSLERALTLVPDHPAGLRLRKVMLK